MKVLAFDAGATVGFALVDSRPGERMRLLRHGSFRHERLFAGEDLFALVGLDPFEVDLVAVEHAAGFAWGGKVRVSALLNCNLVAGMIGGIARAAGLEVSFTTARDVRRELWGNPTSGDLDVKRMVARFLDLPTRSSAHARDAMASAVFVARQWRARRRAAAAAGFGAQP